MVKTQIQLPDELYKEVKELARSKEISIAEICRRGLEYMVSLYPVDTDRKKKWKIPETRSLGEPKVHFSHWRELTHDQFEQ